MIFFKIGTTQFTTLILVVASALAVNASAQDQLPDHVFSGGSASALFGRDINSVGDVNNDGVPDFAIGARNETSGGVNTGVVRVYSGHDLSVIHTFVGNDAGDQFGDAVDGAGDVNNDGFDDVIVGAPLDDDNGSAAGTTFVYSGLDGTLIRSHTGASGSREGSAVTGMGDLDNDGFDDYATSAPFFSGTNGRVRIFSGVDGSLLQDIVSTFTDALLGESIDAIGDTNGDGINDLIAGGSRHSFGSLLNAGVAAVYSGADGSLIYNYLATKTNERLGFDVAAAGDANRDGTPDFVIGAMGYDGFTNAIGRVTLHSGADGSILHTFDGTVSNQRLGFSVDGAGDFNRDGFDDIIVGNVQGTEVFVFSGIDGRTLATLDRTATPADQFGSSVCGLGDINGDNLADVLVGGQFGSTSGTNAGDAFLFFAPPMPVQPYYSTLGAHGLHSYWIADGTNSESLTGSLKCIGATPGATGVIYLSFAPFDTLFLGSIPVLINPDPSQLIESITFGFDLDGTLTVPNVSRQNPALAGLFVFMQFFESSPNAASSNGVAMAVAP